jgi:hypothetical protein
VASVVSARVVNPQAQKFSRIFTDLLNNQRGLFVFHRRIAGIRNTIGNLTGIRNTNYDMSQLAVSNGKDKLGE